MYVRGLRGATTVEANTAEAIVQGARELMEKLIEQNGLVPEQVASVFLTLTPDLNAAFPALGVRTLPGWSQVPLMCAQEIPVPGALPRCIRIMVLVNTDKEAHELRHVYLRDAVQLRPDWS